MKSSMLLYKVITWRIISVITMVLTLWILTGDIGKSTGVTVVVQVIQTFIHAIFEVVWKNLDLEKG